MKADTASRFDSAQEYAAYLKTSEGRLRLDLAWLNLKEFLPSMKDEPNAKALDLGGGTGAMALKLAETGFQVTILDRSKAMLAIAESEAIQAGLSPQISLVHGNVVGLSADAKAKLKPSSFALIICHNLLEYVDDCESVLSNIRTLLKPDGIVSILVRNRAGEVLKAGIKSGDLEQATKNLTAESVTESLYGGDARLFDPHVLRDKLTQFSLEMIAERGVRVMSDYLPACVFQDDAGYASVSALEQKMGRQPEFAAVARYTQLIAKPAGE